MRTIRRPLPGIRESCFRRHDQKRQHNRTEAQAAPHSIIAAHRRVYGGNMPWLHRRLLQAKTRALSEKGSSVSGSVGRGHALPDAARPLEGACEMMGPGVVASRDGCGPLNARGISARPCSRPLTKVRRGRRGRCQPCSRRWLTCTRNWGKDSRLLMAFFAVVLHIKGLFTIVAGAA